MPPVLGLTPAKPPGPGPTATSRQQQAAALPLPTATPPGEAPSLRGTTSHCSQWDGHQSSAGHWASPGTCRAAGG